MSLSYLLVWVHLVAAISWIGGMIFLSLVLAPLVRSRNDTPDFTALFRSVARRFRAVVWGAIAALLSTGPILLSQRGFSIVDPTQWPPVVRIKVGLVAVLLILTISHDLLLGPQIRKVSALHNSGRTPWEQTLILSAAWLPRVALLVALGVVAAAMMLARS